MDTEYLKTLCAVLAAGSFSRAADELNLTQSAVSQRIKLLEERYGQHLVDRTGSEISATVAGQLVQKKAHQMLLLEKELEEALKSLGKKSSISLGCTPTFGIVYLPQVLNRFFLAHSGEVNFTSSLNTPEESLKGLRAKKFDIAVIEHCGNLSFDGTASLSLPPDELVFVSAPALNIPAGEVSLDRLMQELFVARREGCSSRRLLQENLARHGRCLGDFKGLIIHDDLFMTIQTVLAGRGAAFLSHSVVRDHIDRGQLIKHVVPNFHCVRSRAIVMNNGRSEDSFLREFIDCVYSVLDGNERSDQIPVCHYPC
jgi:DNA-binding transcriptional LysR family regulator